MRTRRDRWRHNRTATPENLVVFLVGMQITKPWRVDHWVPTMVAMFPMLAELRRRPELGCLGSRIVIGLDGPTILQYWRDTEALHAYSAATNARHLPSWGAFNRRIGRAANNVGVWHEIFVVRETESVYLDMPVMGLAKAVGASAVGSRTQEARANETRAKEVQATESQGRRSVRAVADVLSRRPRVRIDVAGAGAAATPIDHPAVVHPAGDRAAGEDIAA